MACLALLRYSIHFTRGVLRIVCGRTGNTLVHRHLLQSINLVFIVELFQPWSVWGSKKSLRAGRERLARLYLLELLIRAITVSIETIKIMSCLLKLIVIRNE